MFLDSFLRYSPRFSGANNLKPLVTAAGLGTGIEKTQADARAILSVLIQVAFFPEPTEVQLQAASI